MLECTREYIVVPSLVSSPVATTVLVVEDGPAMDVHVLSVWDDI
jgi:hypothetical protein